MGVKLPPLPSAPAGPEHLAGVTVAIDVPNLLYAFYAVHLLRRETPSVARRGAVAAAWRGVATRVQDLSRHGARSVLLLDGPPHEAKRPHLAARNATRRIPALGEADYAPAEDLAAALGIPVVRAPHDAEAQGCAMAASGLVDVVATTDWDALAMGAPRLLRGLSSRPDGGWRVVDAGEALRHLGTDRVGLAGAAALMGCDYFQGFPGIGPVRALKLLRAHGGDFEAALASLAPDEATREAAREARRLLVDPPHRPWGALAWRDADLPRVGALLRGAAPVHLPPHQARLPQEP